MKKAIIYGTNEIASLLHFHIGKNQQDNPQIAAFVVDAAYHDKESFCGLPVHNAEDMINQFPPEEYAVYIGIGYKEMNKGRQNVFLRLKEQGYSMPDFIHPTALIYANPIGEGNLFMPYTIIDPHTSLGNCNIFLANSMVAHHSTVGSFNFFSTYVGVAGNVAIGDACFFSVHAATRDKITIGNRCMVGVNASVSQSIPDDTLIAPAKEKVVEGGVRFIEF